jgi:hypothetical protein
VSTDTYLRRSPEATPVISKIITSSTVLNAMQHSLGISDEIRNKLIVSEVHIGRGRWVIVEITEGKYEGEIAIPEVSTRDEECLVSWLNRWKAGRDRE